MCIIMCSFTRGEWTAVRERVCIIYEHCYYIIYGFNVLPIYLSIWQLNLVKNYAAALNKLWVLIECEWTGIRIWIWISWNKSTCSSFLQAGKNRPNLKRQTNISQYAGNGFGKYFMFKFFLLLGLELNLIWFRSCISPYISEKSLHLIHNVFFSVVLKFDDGKQNRKKTTTVCFCQSKRLK